MKIPSANRPALSGYVSAGKLLPWSWVDVRMIRSRNYWVATRAKNFPSSRPVWGIWHDCSLYFSTGSAIGRNIKQDPRVQVNLESADELVILEGTASTLAGERLDFWTHSYKEKYNWDMPSSTDGVFVVAPSRVLAWISDPTGQDGGALFSNTATEWRFDGDV